MPADFDKLQGAWNITSLEVDGRELAKETFEGSRILVNGNDFESIAMGSRYEGKIELDQNQKPKCFDLIFTAGPEKGNRNVGIYELEGDTWTICLAMRGKHRPKKFATAQGTGFALETLRRDNARHKSRKIEKANQPEPEVGPVGPATELEGEWSMLSAVFDGAPMEQSMVKWCRRITRGNITKVLAGPQVFLNASFSVDDKQNPPRIDYLNLSDPNKGKSQAGIFELSDGQLSICMAAPGRPRPKDFQSKPGDGRSFTIWRLVKE